MTRGFDRSYSAIVFISSYVFADHVKFLLFYVAHSILAVVVIEGFYVSTVSIFIENDLFIISIIKIL